MEFPGTLILGPGISVGCCMYQRFVEFLRGEVLVCLEFLGEAQGRTVKIQKGGRNLE